MIGKIDMETPVDDVISMYPKLGIMFVRQRMLCVGCDIAHFHSLNDVAQIYKMSPDEFHDMLVTWINEQSEPLGDHDQ